MKRSVIAVAAVLCLLLGSLAFTSSASVSPDNYPHIKNGEIDLLGYFETKGASAKLQEESIDFTLTAETATITFDKPLVADGFNFQWIGVNDSGKKLQALTLTLADSEDADCALKTTFSRISDTAVGFKVNDTPRTYMVPGNLHTVADANFTLIYSEESHSLTDGMNFTVVADKCQNGNSFNGFASNAVRISMTVTGKTGATFSLKSINRQRFGTAFVQDNVAPSVYVPMSLTKALYNSTVTLPKASAYDVLAKSATLTLTVKSPSGEVLKTTDGTLLENVAGDREYKVKLNEYGAYRVQYVASDGVNATRSIGYQIAVADTGAPILKLTEEIPTFVKVGEAVSLPAAEITDNVSEADACVYWINVKHPCGKITAEKDSFTPDVQGHYEITYSCYDEQGNLCRLKTTVYAEKGAGK